MTAPLPDLREGAEAWVTEHVSCPNPNCKRLNLCAECMTIVSDLRERDRQWRDMVVDALARLAEVERERDEMRGKVAHECGWCGYEQVGPDGMREHAMTCAKSPLVRALAASQAREARLREVLDDVWASIGDALCSGRGIEREYAWDVQRKVKSALAASPAQSLAAHDAEVRAMALREAADVSDSEAVYNAARGGGPRSAQTIIAVRDTQRAAKSAILALAERAPEVER